MAVGFASGAWGDAPSAALVQKNASVLGVYVGAYDHSTLLETHDELLRLWSKGEIGALVTREVPFEELPAGLSDLADRRVTGKLVTLPHSR